MCVYVHIALLLIFIDPWLSPNLFFLLLLASVRGSSVHITLHRKRKDKTKSGDLFLAIRRSLHYPFVVLASASPASTTFARLWRVLVTILRSQILTYLTARWNISAFHWIRQVRTRHLVTGRSRFVSYFSEYA